MAKVSIKSGALFVVATPIGNLADISARALEILARVEVIAAEDTRHTRQLLQHFAITTPCVALHEHNERQQVPGLLVRLQQGERVALVSDAGTPLISDPGFHLVRAARQAGIQVVPIPGASALITALSASGLPSDRFVFEGFLPARGEARRRRLEELQHDTRTLIFYEAKHRILDTLEDMQAVFGAGRESVLARELTKTFETIHQGALQEQLALLARDANQCKGEFVILIAGAAAEQRHEVSVRAERVLAVLLEELPVKQAAALAAKITGGKKNQLYEMALALKTVK
ncbi:MAG: 16S rRNA (cytidine(1402)-2'-O)-methyltransferase [Gammaproteobacteria bacterium RBG_16_57_12]|nr:MAG: 16S rRNA (cytidine(1402)-2'-O)-methyltransferase [Gammaproteobacteria bacterium RBG_16_57_12]